MLKRRAQAPIVDITTDGRRWVCLRVAAEYLELDERTVRARIDDGELEAQVDGKVIHVPLVELRNYERRRRLAS